MYLPNRVEGLIEFHQFEFHHLKRPRKSLIKHEYISFTRDGGVSLRYRLETECRKG